MNAPSTLISKVLATDPQRTRAPRRSCEATKRSLAWCSELIDRLFRTDESGFQQTRRRCG